MSWNVQGIKMKLANKDFTYYCTQFSIFACSEINNCPEEKLLQTFPNYECYTSKREGYTGRGVAVFVHNSLFHLVSKLNVDKPIDECICLIADESCFSVNKKVVLCFPYVPLESSPVFSDTNIKGLQRLEVMYHEINNKLCDIDWLIAGDFNARSGLLDDCFVENNVTKFITQFEHEDCLFDEIFQRRNFRDYFFVNSYGKQLTTFCRQNSLCLANGRTCGDEVGNITCIANKGRTVVDYFVLSCHFFQSLQTFVVEPRPESDHFPINGKFFSNSLNDTNKKK